MKRAMLMLMAVLFSLSSFAQDVITLGSGSVSGAYIPNYNNIEFSMSQCIYLASEINSNGQIVSLAYKASDNAVTRTFSIYMAEVEKTSYSGLSDLVPNDQFTLVYSGSYTPVNGEWATIELDEVFTYYGTGNLVIAVLDQTGTWQNSSTHWYGDNASANMAIYDFSYTSCTAPGEPLYGYGTPVNFRPTIQLGFTYTQGDYCYTPSLLHAAASDESSITLQWNENGTATQWKLNYKAKTSSQWEEIIVDETTYTVGGLDENTEYEFKVAAICGEGESTPSSVVSAKTACALITQLPWTDDFEDHAGSEDLGCWRAIVSASNFPNLITWGGAVYQGSKALEFKMGNQMIAFPNFEQDISTLRVSFYYRCNAYSGGTVELGYLTDVYNPQSFIVIDTIPYFYGDGSGEANFTHYLRNLNDVESMEANLALRYTSVNGNCSWYFDNFVVEDVPDCTGPEANSLAFVSSTTNSATLTWTDPNENNSDWRIYYKTLDEQQYQYVDVEQTTATIEGLASSTTYNAYVVTLCGGEPSVDASNTITFFTACEPIENLPYTMTFEDEFALSCMTHAQTSSYADWMGNVRIFPMVTIASSVSHEGLGSMEFMGGDVVTAFPETQLDITDLRIAFFAKCNSVSIADAGIVEIGYISDATDANTFVVMDTLTFFNDAQYHKYVYAFNLAQAGSRIALRYTSSYTTTSWYFDDVVIDNIPACAGPLYSSVSFSNVTDSQATISWYDPDPEHVAWRLYYKQQNEELYTMVEASQQSYTLTSLESNTKYNVYVTSMCGQQESTDATDIFVLKTTTTPVAFPYFNDFEGEDAINDFSITGDDGINTWIVGNATSNPESIEEAHSLYISSNGSDYNSECANNWNFTNTYDLATMTVQFPAEAMEYHLTFDYKMGNTAYPYEGVAVFMADGGVEVDQTVPSNAEVIMDWTNSVLDWTSFDAILNNVAGTTKQIIFAYKVMSYSFFHTSMPAAIDNISLVGYTCAMPTNLAASEVSENSITVAWQENGSATQWNVSYRQSGTNAAFETFSANTPSYTISGLEPNTLYEVYVTSVCDEGEVSNASTVLNIRTGCGVVTTLPWFDGFEDYEGSGVAVELVCWTALQSYTADNGTFPAVYTGYSSPCHNSSNSLELKGNNQMLILPDFAEDIHNLRLSFWATATNTSIGTLQVGVLTDPSNLESFELVATCGEPSERNGIGNYMGPFDFNNVQALEGRIALKYSSTYASESWNLDDFTVTLIPTCLAPNSTPVVSDITSTTAVVTWTDDNEQHNAWTVSYRILGQSEYTIVSTTTTTAVLNNLVPGSKYEVYVQTYCGEEPNLETTPIVTFTTACDVVSSFPYLETFGGEEFICWSSEIVSGSEDWIIYSNSAQFSYLPNNKARLISPVFNLSNLENASLSYKYYIREYSEGHTWDSLAVLYRTSDQVAWQVIQGYNAATSGFVADTILLPNPSATYQVAFLGVGQDGYNIFIDDVSIFSSDGSSTPDPCTPTSSTIDTAVCQNTLPFTWNGQNVDAAGTFTYTTTNAAGCDSTVTLNVLVNAISTASVDTAVCSTDFPFTWNEQDVDAAGVYTYTTTNAAGCDSTITLNVNVYQQTVAEDVTVTLNNADLPYTYETGLVCDEFATYEINAVDENGCTYTYNLIVEHNEGLMDAEANMSVTLYPNPTSGDAILSIEGLNEDATILVTDVQGRVISTSTLATGEMTTTIETSNLPAGVYYVRVLTATTTNTQKLIKK